MILLVSNDCRTLKHYAHSAPEGHEWQGLKEHLEAVAGRARSFADKFGAGVWAEAAGLLHDIGKYSDAFQARLEGDPASVDHSTAGAHLAREQYNVAGNLLAAGVAGHHAGLANGNIPGARTMLADRLAANIPNYSAWELEITLPALTAPRLERHSTVGDQRVGFQFAHLGRMIFSSLVDADYLDTEAFYAMVEGWQIDRGNWQALPVLREEFNAFMAGLSRPGRRINDIRADILAASRRAALDEPGVYMMTVPTGGGKTLSSLAFGLDHAIQYGLDRIIEARR